MSGQWREVVPLGATYGGDVGGDAQVSDSWSRQWVLERRDDGLLPLLTAYFYVAREDHTDDSDERLVVQRQVEYMLCRDLSDPGGTEEFCDYSYERLPMPWQPMAQDARRACDEMSAPTLEDWNGTEEHAGERVRALATSRA